MPPSPTIRRLPANEGRREHRQGTRALSRRFYPAKPHGTNSEGLRRRGFAASDIAAIRRAYKALYRNKLSFEDARAAIAVEAGKVPALGIMAQFLETPGRGIIR